MKERISLKEIQQAQENIKGMVMNTPLTLMPNFSEEYKANIYFKREDLQTVRSYKIRGAFNKIKSLSKESLEKGIVCASAGNHAQGVAFSCAHLQVFGTIFMPQTTPKQKVDSVKMFGGDFVEVVLTGDTFDDSYQFAMQFCNEKRKTFIHPFDDEKIIAGQGTIGLELLEQTSDRIDYIFLPVGGGGLASGVIRAFELLSPHTKIIGVEPEGAPSLDTSLKEGQNTRIEQIEKFVDGAAVQQMGEITFEYCKSLEDNKLIPEGLVCKNILKVYNENAMVVEPAGVLSVSALDFYKKEIQGKNVVCIISGGNNDITRMEEMKERALLYEGVLHYFIVDFPQRAGALKEFLIEVLGPNDDITHFQYTKKNSRFQAPAVVGIEVKDSKDFNLLVKRMKEKGYYGEYLNEKPQLFQYII
ncbi:threonine ammonia-lyase [Flavobacteriaceae bacterium UJ101]|nr:threonine ammonia-lyase [Flavobacteriaceae bacterium UJ101]